MNLENLRSEPSNGAMVRFYNLSNTESEVVWINHQGEPKLYSSLKPKQFQDVDTFERHCWIFREKHTGSPLRANNNAYFFPQNENYFKTDHSKPGRYIVFISHPIIPSLKSLCIQHISNQLNNNCRAVKNLEIPKTLIKDILKRIHRHSKHLHRSASECENNLKNEFNTGKVVTSVLS